MNTVAAVIYISEFQSIVRERTFSTDSSLNEILSLLRDSRACGQLTLDINCGGVGTIRFREEKKITPARNNT